MNQTFRALLSQSLEADLAEWVKSSPSFILVWGQTDRAAENSSMPNAGSVTKRSTLMIGFIKSFRVPRHSPVIDLLWRVLLPCVTLIHYVSAERLTDQKQRERKERKEREEVIEGGRKKERPTSVTSVADHLDMRLWVTVTFIRTAGCMKVTLHKPPLWYQNKSSRLNPPSLWSRRHICLTGI